MYDLFFWLHWIEKWSSGGRRLEKFKSSGTKIVLRGHIVGQML